MTHAEKPIFLIADRNGWLCLTVGPDLDAALAFGTEQDARRYLEHTAERRGDMAALYRVVEYRFSGRVKEG